MEPTNLMLDIRDHAQDLRCLDVLGWLVGNAAAASAREVEVRAKHHARREKRYSGY